MTFQIILMAFACFLGGMSAGLVLFAFPAQRAHGETIDNWKKALDGWRKTMDLLEEGKKIIELQANTIKKYETIPTKTGQKLGKK